VSLIVRASIATLVLTALALPGAAQPGIPPLPHPALHLFPPSARESVAAAYERAAERSGDAGAAGVLGSVLHAWDQWDAAHDAYSRAQALDPRAFEWHYLDGIALQRLARHAEAAARFRRAHDLSPGFLPAHVRLADALLEAGELDQSGVLFVALIRHDATAGLGHFGLGRIAALRGDHATAISRLELAVGLVPVWGAAHYALALSYRAEGRRADATRALERHAEHGPSWPALEDPVLASVTALREDAVANLQRGLRLADAGDLAGAIAAHEAALALDPALAQAHANLISLYGRSQDWTRAEEHYRTVLDLGFGLDAAHYDYGVLLAMQGKWKAAADAYRRAIDVNPLHARAHNNLGGLLEREQEIEAAAVSYRQAVTSEPLFRLARFNVARLLLVGGRLDEAIEELEKIVHPRDAEAPLYLFALAGAHLKGGQKEQGIRWAREARQLASAHAQHGLVAAINRALDMLK